MEFNHDEIIILPIHEQLVINKFISKENTHDIIIGGRIVTLGEKDARQELDKVTLDGNIIYDRSSIPSSIVNVFELLALMNDSVLFIDYDRYFKNEVEDKSINELIPSNFRNWLFNLSMSSNRKDFNEIVKSARKFKITSTDPRFSHNEKSNPFNKNFDYRFGRNDHEIDIFFRNDYGEMPLSSFGTGVQQIIYLIFKIFDFKPKILLMEEIELNLSPKYQDVLIKYFDSLINSNKFLKQVFITSHSPLHCYRSQDRSLRTTLNDSGETEFEKFILTKAENTNLKEAHNFLIKSVYGIEKKEDETNVVETKAVQKKIAEKKVKKERLKKQ